MPSLTVHPAVRVGLLLCACAALEAGAQDLAGLERPAPLQDMQVTATRNAKLVYDVAQGVTLVGREEVERESPQVLAEALRGRVGTFFQQTTPGQGTAIIRGLKGSQILHLVDGMRLNNAFFRSAPNQYLALVDAYAVEQTEVIRGSAGTLYGADAMGGVIQMLTGEPEFRGDDWTLEADGYASYRHADRGKVFRAESAMGKEGMAFSAGVTWQDYGDRRTGSERISPSEYDSTAADAKLFFGLGEYSDLMLSYQTVDQPNTPRVDELIPGFGQDEPSSELFAFRPNQRDFYHARFRTAPGLLWLDHVEVHLARQTITDDRRTRDFGSTLTTDESNESELTGLTVELGTPLTSRLHLTYGVELYYDDVSSSRRRTDSTTGVTERVPGRFPDDSSMDSIAGYLYGEWDPHPNLTIGGGMRYSRFDIKLPQASGGDATLEPDDVSGDLHVTWRLTDGLNLVSNLGRGFRAPNIFDLGTLGVRPGNRFNVANPDLDPETVWSLDAGFKFSSARWGAELFGFYSDYDDKITSIATGEITPEGRTVVRSENANQVEIYGIEAGGQYQLTERLELYGVLNYARGDEEDAEGNDEPADRMPPLNAKLGAIYTPTDTLRFEAYSLMADDQDRLSDRDEDDPRIDPNGTPGWGTINLALDWQALPSTTVGFRVDNLGDRRYREHGSGIDAPGRSVGVWLRSGFSR